MPDTQKIYVVVACKKGLIIPAFRDVTQRTKADATKEAERRNREDPERTRYTFKVMLESDAEKY